MRETSGCKELAENMSGSEDKDFSCKPPQAGSAGSPCHPKQGHNGDIAGEEAFSVQEEARSGAVLLPVTRAQGTSCPGQQGGAKAEDGCQSTAPGSYSRCDTVRAGFLEGEEASQMLFFENPKQSANRVEKLPMGLHPWGKPKVNEQ